MTQLSLDATNYLTSFPDITSLLAKSTKWPNGWLFDERPYNAIEGTGQAMIVVTADTAWTGANDSNTLRFPKLTVDIWVDPTRDPADKSVKVFDATRRAEVIWKRVDKRLHTMKRSGSIDGAPLIWGTPTQIIAGTGSFIVSSQRLSGEPTYSPMKENDGAFMARCEYGVHLA